MAGVSRRYAMGLIAGGFAASAAGPGAAQARAPVSGAIHVSPDGDDRTGTGTTARPYKTPARAVSAAGPGATIYLRPGTYAPFMITRSGAPGAPITVTTLPGEERQAIIQGDLQRHVINGGTGGSDKLPWRSGIRIEKQDYIHIRNLTVQDCAYEGIYVLGGEAGTQHGHHVLAGNLVRRTGNPGIMVAGFAPWRGRRPSEARPRTVDVIIEDNDVSETNVVTDFNSKLANSQGDPGGKNEAITVTSSCGQIITRFNDVHDSRQYGIDYKAGVAGGAIHGNRIWNIERYGIYLDTGRNTLRDIDVYDNDIRACRIGITIAREADVTETDPHQTPLAQSLININIFNNICRDMELLGVYCQAHPGDGPQGEITDLRVRFNTVYNCNRSGKGNSVRLDGWSRPEWRAAGVVRGFDFVGNIIYNTDGPAGVVDEFSGEEGFDIRDNLVDVDPLFRDPSQGDFALQRNSPALGMVSAGYASTPFDVTAAGIPRADPANAGAL